MSIVDKLLEAEGAIQSEAYDPDLDKLLHKAAAEVEALVAVNAELLEALVELRKWQAPCGQDPDIDAALQAADRAIAKAKGDDHA